LAWLKEASVLGTDPFFFAGDFSVGKEINEHTDLKLWI